MTTTESTFQTLRSQRNIADEVSNLTMHISGNSSELVQHLGFLGDKIEDQANATVHVGDLARNGEQCSNGHVCLWLNVFDNWD